MMMLLLIIIVITIIVITIIIRCNNNNINSDSSSSPARDARTLHWNAARRSAGRRLLGINRETSTVGRLLSHGLSRAGASGASWPR